MSLAWNAKDPQSVIDYRYTVPLDEGDTVATATIAKLSGAVVLDSQAPNDAEITVWLSGGTDGEVAVFRAEWTTAGGRSSDEIITLPVVANEITPLVFDGYAKPSPAHMIQRYPAFAAVAAPTIQMWLTDAERMVDTGWPEGDYAPALMMLAAHNMALQGIGAGEGAIPAGVTSFKSGAVSITVAESAASARSKGGYAATPYGIEFKAMLARTKSGPRLIARGTLACAW